MDMSRLVFGSVKIANVPMSSVAYNDYEVL